MKTVTLERFKFFYPGLLETEEGIKRIEEIGSSKSEWTALDVLNLEEVNLFDRLLYVLLEDFVSDKILHEFACRCAERVLKMKGVNDNRSWNAIDAKRKWLRGEITDKELSCAMDSAYDVDFDAAWASAGEYASSAALYSSMDAYMVANLDYDFDEELKLQIEDLKKMILEEKESEEIEK